MIGTRGSALALAQAHLTREALRAAFSGREVTIKEIKTTGDRRLDLSLTTLSPDAHGYETSVPRERLDPGLFTKELEAELLAGTITVAVHSLKDLPTAMPPGLMLAAVLPRADTADVLIYKEGASDNGAILPMLPEGATVATSSLRRQRQLLWRRPDLRVEEVRGNVGTRLGKLRDRADWSAMILARAGLDRLGHAETLRAGYLETAEAGRFAAENLTLMLPAVGQGAIGLQTRAEDAAEFEAINCARTMTCVLAERELLRLLGGGCQMPLGVATRLDGEELRMEAGLFVGQDGAPRTAQAVAAGPEELARAVAAQLTAALG